MTASINSPNGAYARPEAPGRPSHKHGYIYGSRMAGCLYDNGPHWVETRAEALDALCLDFDDCFDTDGLQRFRDILARDRYYAFAPEQHSGADYAEITEATAEQAAQFQESDE